MSNIFSTTFQKIDTSISAWFKTISPVEKTLATSALVQIENNGGEVLATAANTAVQDAQATNLTGKEKFAKAEADVWAILKTAAVTAEQASVNLAIEMAVAALPALVKTAIV